MICLLLFICCLAAAIALAVGVVLKTITTLVEALLDIVTSYGMILAGVVLFCLAVFIVISLVMEFMGGTNILLLLLSLGLWVLSIGLLILFATVIASLAYMALAIIAFLAMVVSESLGNLSMGLFSKMLGLMVKQSERK